MTAQGQITVHYARKASDGNYGNEEAACSITLPVAPEAHDDGYLRVLAGELNEAARWIVRQQLALSPEPQVRHAGETRAERDHRLAVAEHLAKLAQARRNVSYQRDRARRAREAAEAWQARDVAELEAEGRLYLRDEAVDAVEKAEAEQLAAENRLALAVAACSALPVPEALVKAELAHLEEGDDMPF